MPLNRRSLLGKGFLALGAGIVAKGALAGPIQAAPDTHAALKDLTPILQSGTLEPRKLERYMADHFRESTYEGALPIRLMKIEHKFHTTDVTSWSSYGRVLDLQPAIGEIRVEAVVPLTDGTISVSGAFFESFRAGKKAYIVFADDEETGQSRPS